MKNKILPDLKPESRPRKKRGKLAPPYKISLSVTILLIALSLIFYPRLQPVIPLFYSQLQPEKQLVDKMFIFLLPMMSLSINLIHIILQKACKNLDKLVLQLVAWSTVVLQAILLLVTARILIIIL